MPGTPDVRLEFHEVDEQRWPDLVRVLEGRGGPRHCWCLLWREPPRVRQAMDLDDRREAMHARVRQGVPIGILGYVDGEPAAWCSVAPRDTYVDLGGPEDADGGSVWSIACFFVQTRHRRQGLSAALLDAAVEVARRHGADVVEAYPVDRSRPPRVHGLPPGVRGRGVRGGRTRRHAPPCRALAGPEARR